MSFYILIRKEKEHAGHSDIKQREFDIIVVKPENNTTVFRKKKKKTKNNRTGAVGSWEQWQPRILKPPLKSKTAPIPAEILLLHLGQMAGTKALKLTC